MGLDQWFFAEIDDERGDIEIAYYRKHPDLHGWMEDRWLSQEAKSATAAEFNCVRLYLDEDDLADLRRDVKNWNLPETQGFFFGDGRPDDECNERYFETINACLAWLDKGHRVYYTSWW